MITPLDIQNKSFTKAMRGYKAEEVDTFLDMLTLDMEKLIKENNRLQSQVGEMESELNKYKGSEGEVVKVLQQAKQLMDDISKSAEKRADVIIKNAELDADMILREAKDNAAVLKEENVTLKNRYENFRNRYEKMLQEELQHFRTLTDNLFPEFENDKLQEILSEGDEPADSAPAAAAEEADVKTALMDDLSGDDLSKGAAPAAENDSSSLEKTLVRGELKPNALEDLLAADAEKDTASTDDMKKTMVIDMDQMGKE